MSGSGGRLGLGTSAALRVGVAITVIAVNVSARYDKGQIRLFIRGPPRAGLVPLQAWERPGGTGPCNWTLKSSTPERAARGVSHCGHGSFEGAAALRPSGNQRNVSLQNTGLGTMRSCPPNPESESFRSV